MVDNKLEIEEAQRAENYEAIKSNVKADVGGEISAYTDRPTVSETAQTQDLAMGMRQKAISEIAATDREVERGRFMARISQFVDYTFFLIYGALAIRLLLELFAARESAGFVKFIKSVTGIFYAPFAGIVPSPSKEDFTLALPIIIAIVAYMVLHLAINGLLKLFAQRKTAI
ncbi:MAG TPA: hypothetical protein PKE69_27465 [Pyrinomonadaceae bacterium]|nr:hypothetical protein [Pyrinomonadaceae bacterium]